MEEVTKKNLEDIKELERNGLVDIAVPPASPKDTDWDPEEFKKTVRAYPKYPRAEKPESIGHCKIFWGWYAGIISAPNDVDALACGLLSPIQIDGYDILHQDLIGLTPNIPDASAVKPTDKFEVYHVGSTVTKQTVLKFSSGSSISVPQCLAWINNILKILDQKDLGSAEEKQDELVQIQRLTALVFLNCCRLATKDPVHVQEHIATTVISRASSLFSIPMSKISICPVFVVPSYNFMITFSEIIKKGAAISKQILGRIIYSYVHVEKESEAVRSVYRTGCLLSLSYTGLSPVAWLVKAAKAKSMSQLQLLKKLYIPKMESFITKYISLSKISDASWVYCRLLSDSALLKLSASNEPLATAVFVALCYNPKAPDMAVWEIPSLQCISYEDVVRAHCISEAMMESPELLVEQKPLTKEAEELTQKLQTTAKNCYEKQQMVFRTLFNQNRSMLPKNVDSEDQEQIEQGDGEPGDDNEQPGQEQPAGDQAADGSDPSGSRFD